MTVSRRRSVATTVAVCTAVAVCVLLRWPRNEGAHSRQPPPGRILSLAQGSTAQRSNKTPLILKAAAGDWAAAWRRLLSSSSSSSSSQSQSLPPPGLSRRQARSKKKKSSGLKRESPSALRSPRATPGGVILWAAGRSATDTFAGSARETAGWQYCRGQKEGFKDAKPTAKRLSSCVARGERITHVKPQHLRKSPLANETDFFRAAQRAGFTVVAASFRANVLAREVSSFELTAPKAPEKRAARNRAMFCRRDLNDAFRKQRDDYDRGVRAAYDTPGLDVLELSFDDVTRGLCDSVSRTLALVSPTLGARPCRVFSSPHTRTSRHQLGLRGRLGEESYECVVRQLNEQHPELRWMLDIYAEKPESSTYYNGGEPPPPRTTTTTTSRRSSLLNATTVDNDDDDDAPHQESVWHPATPASKSLWKHSKHHHVAGKRRD